MASIDYHITTRAMTGEPMECGDTGIVMVEDGICLIALIDALGHGREANEVSRRAEAYISTAFRKGPAEIIRGLHSHLEGTRGVVAAVCRLALDTGALLYSGIGNITLKIYSKQSRQLLTRDGVIGYMISAPTEREDILDYGDILVLTSDGIKQHFDLAVYPDLLLGTADMIAKEFMEKLGKSNDDASCIALRYGV